MPAMIFPYLQPVPKKKGACKFVSCFWLFISLFPAKCQRIEDKCKMLTVAREEKIGKVQGRVL